MGLLRNLAKKVLGKQEAPKPSPPVATPAPKAPAPTGSGTDKPWYLDGQNDGWDETDVKKDGS